MEENNKITALTIAQSNVEMLVEALTKMLENSSGHYNNMWRTTNMSYKNYISNKAYKGGLNLFNFYMLSLVQGYIIGEEARSNYYITANEAFKMGWKFKEEFKTWTSDNNERIKELKVLKEKIIKEKNADKIKELKKEINDLSLEILKHKIWNEVYFFTFNYISFTKKNDTWYKQNWISTYQNGKQIFVLKNETKIDESKVIQKGIDNIISFPTLKFYKVAPIEFYDRSTKEIKGRIIPENELLDSNVKETLDAWTTLKNYAKRENLKVEYKKQNQAYYNFVEDFVVLPLLEQFYNEKNGLSVTTHEFIHSTGAEKRLDRGLLKINDGNTLEKYSLEEVVTEVGTMFFLLKTDNLTNELLDNSISYIKGYLEQTKNKQNNIVYAINNGLKAVDYIFGDTNTDEEKNVVEEE